VHDRLIEPQRGADAERCARPSVTVALPELRRDQARLLAVRPAALRPEVGPVVAAVVDEGEELPVGHRCDIDREPVDLHRMGWAFVVQRPRIGRRTHQEFACGNDDLAVDPNPPDRRGRGREHRRADPQLVGGQHGLVVLLFVLGDHAEDETVVHQRSTGQITGIEDIEDLFAHRADVTARLLGIQQRQRRTIDPGVLERVVDLIDIGAHRLAPTDIAHQPQFFLIPDMCQIPDQR